MASPQNVLRRIKRGLVGHVSYLAACEANEAFSEYVLYEPILRILLSQRFKVNCEVICPGVPQPANSGDKKRLDFVAETAGLRFAIEVKWAKRQRLNVTTDLTKLKAFRNTTVGNRSFLCVFGRMSAVKNVSFTAVLNVTTSEYGDPVLADLAQTKYMCRIFEVM